jgi:hypothetical protein
MVSIPCLLLCSTHFDVLNVVGVDGSYVRTASGTFLHLDCLFSGKLFSNEFTKFMSVPLFGDFIVLDLLDEFILYSSSEPKAPTSLDATRQANERSE